MAKRTYYKILGVGHTATEDEVKKAYRRLAREYHPDVNPSPDAEANFKEINLAYATLSDSLKRADYDQEIADSGVRGGAANAGGAASAGTTGGYSQPNATAGAGYGRPAPSGTAGSGATAPGPAGTAGSGYESPYRAAQIRAAVARVVGLALLSAMVGFFLQLGLDLLFGRPFSPARVALGSLPAGAIGAFWAADLNFKVETFMGSGWLGRSYTFARTVLMSLSLAYYLGLVGAAIDRAAFGSTPVVTVPLVLLGVLVGAVAGSDGDTPEKLRSNTGRFNLFYTLLRGAEVGAIGAVLAAGLGAILAASGVGGVFGYSVFIGFALGMIIGSIQPPNLAAYASYASASVKNIIVILMVFGALLLGIVFGVTFAPEFGRILGLAGGG